MSWKCFIVGIPWEPPNTPFSMLEIGAMWFEDKGTDDQRWCVKLPGGELFCSDYTDSDSRKPWSITGEAPNVTVDPSINCVGTYHGWIRDGVISDDCEGRTFP